MHSLLCAALLLHIQEYLELAESWKSYMDWSACFSRLSAHEQDKRVMPQVVSRTSRPYSTPLHYNIIHICTVWTIPRKSPGSCDWFSQSQWELCVRWFPCIGHIQVPQGYFAGKSNALKLIQWSERCGRSDTQGREDGLRERKTRGTKRECVRERKRKRKRGERAVIGESWEEKEHEEKKNERQERQQG